MDRPPKEDKKTTLKDLDRDHQACLNLFQETMLILGACNGYHEKLPGLKHSADQYRLTVKGFEEQFAKAKESHKLLLKSIATFARHAKNPVDEEVAQKARALVAEREMNEAILAGSVGFWDTQVSFAATQDKSPSL